MNSNNNKTFKSNKNSGFKGERRTNSSSGSYRRSGGNDKAKSYSRPNEKFSGSSIGAGKKPYNKGGFKKRPPMTPPVDIDTLKRAIITKIDESVDKETFFYRYNLNEKKKETGIIGLSLKTYLKENQKIERYIHIYIIQDRSKKVSVIITDGTLSSATVLFNTISNDPTEKVLKFLPEIIKSLEKMTLDLK